MANNKHNLENNPYGERLDSVRQLSGHDKLDDTDKSIIAHLAFDKDLEDTDFYKTALEIIHEKRAMGGRCAQCVFCGAIRWTPSIV